MQAVFNLPSKSTVPVVQPHLIAVGLSLIVGEAEQGKPLGLTLNPGTVKSDKRTFSIPINLMVGWGRDAIKTEIMRQVDSLFDAAEGTGK